MLLGFAPLAFVRNLRGLQGEYETAAAHREAGQWSLSCALIDAFYLATEPAIVTFRDGDDQRHWSKRRLDHAVPVAHHGGLSLNGQSDEQQHESPNDRANDPHDTSSFGDAVHQCLDDLPIVDI